MRHVIMPTLVWTRFCLKSRTVKHLHCPRVVLLEVVSARDSDSLDPIAVTVRAKGLDPS